MPIQQGFVQYVGFEKKSSSRRSSVYYPFIADGCPVDEYTSLSPRLDLEDRFSTQTFKFQDSSFVYIQCDVIVCDLRVPNDPECQSTCRNDEAVRQTVWFYFFLQLNISKL